MGARKGGAGVEVELRGGSEREVWHHPATLARALALLAELPGARVRGGGTGHLHGGASHQGIASNYV